MESSRVRGIRVKEEIMIFNIILILASLAAAAIFPRYFRHVYKVGHEDIIKSFSVGMAALFCVWVLMLVGHFAIPKGRQAIAVIVLLSPVMLAAFSTGYALIFGLAGLDGGKNRFLAILVVGGAAAFAEAFFVVYGKFISDGVFIYGLGACLLSFHYPMEEEAPGDGLPETEVPVFQPRRSLGGDLTPLPRPGVPDDDRP